MCTSAYGRVPLVHVGCFACPVIGMRVKVVDRISRAASCSTE